MPTLSAGEARGWNPHWAGVLFDERALLQMAREYRKQYGTYPATDARSTWAEKLIDAELDGGLVWEVSPGVYSRDLVDRWGTPYVFIPPADLNADADDPAQQPRIGSFGDNGVDDGGSGDDLWSDRGVNDGWYCYARRPTMRRLLSVFGAGLAAWVAVMVFRPELRRMLSILLPAYASIAYIVCAPMSDTTFWVPTLSGLMLWRAAYRMGWCVLFCTGMQVLVRIAVKAMRGRGAAAGACISCGYSLIGLPKTVICCPECGTVRTAEDAAR